MSQRPRYRARSAAIGREWPADIDHKTRPDRVVSAGMAGLRRAWPGWQAGPQPGMMAG